MRTTITLAALLLLTLAACTHPNDPDTLVATGPVAINPTATLATHHASATRAEGTDDRPIILTGGTLPITMSGGTLTSPVTRHYTIGSTVVGGTVTLTPGTDGKLVAPNPDDYNFSVAPTRVSAKVNTNITAGDGTQTSTLLLPMNLRVSMSEAPRTIEQNGALALTLAPATAALRLELYTDAGVSLTNVTCLPTGEVAPMLDAPNADAANTASRIIFVGGSSPATSAVAFGMLPAGTTISPTNPLTLITTTTGNTLALLPPATLILAAGQMLTYTVHVSHAVATITQVEITTFAQGNGAGDDLTVGDSQIVTVTGQEPTFASLLTAATPVWNITGTNPGLGSVEAALNAAATADLNARIHLLMPAYSGGIGEFVFDYCTALASLSAPRATSIGQYAFYHCTTLASLHMPTVTTIEQGAFESCTTLASLHLPVAKSIGKRAFNDCTALASVSLPAAESIGEYAFRVCSALASVHLPSARTIVKGTFYGCSALATLRLPAARTIDYGAFYGCTALTRLELTAPAFTSVSPDAFNDAPTENITLVLNSSNNTVTVNGTNATFPTGTGGTVTIPFKSIQRINPRQQ